MNKKVIIIGSGFSGLSAACYMAQQGCKVTIHEKNSQIGGRARQFRKDGFTFDMGPTFYWMPDIMEAFFADFGKSSRDYYELIRLDPGYQVYFGKNDSLSMPAQLEGIMDLFEKEEPGSGRFLKQFLKEAEFNYRVAIDKVVYKPGKSPLELIMPATAARFMQFLMSLSRKVKQNIRSPKLQQILEFPVIFLGAKPSSTPAFYCFMNYADMVLGTWHIRGGMYELVRAMEQLARSMGVEIKTRSPIDKVITRNGRAKGVETNGEFFEADLIISGADYHHTESLLTDKERNYSERYWEKRVMAPSALLYYMGFDKNLKNMSHHTLFFDTDFNRHAEKIYDSPGWPDDPLFYASFPTKTDVSMGPQGKEAGVFLIPIASGIEDSQEIREHYYDRIIERMERLTSQSIRPDVLFSESYAVSNFTRDYNAYKGNAYGLSNILLQTAFLKPKVENRKIENLFYTGQLTVPGPGVPPAIISGKIAAGLAMSYFKKTKKYGQTIS